MRGVEETEIVGGESWRGERVDSEDEGEDNVAGGDGSGSRHGERFADVSIQW